jgi:hypothetical protein
LQTRTVEIAGIDIPYRIRHSKRAKRPRIQIAGGDGIVVVLPAGYPVKRAGDLLNEHSDWVIRALRKLDNKPRAFPARSFAPGASFPYLGELFTLAVQPSSSASARATLRSGELLITLPRDVIGDENHIRALLRKWYRDRARAEIEPRAHSYAAEMGVNFNRIFIKDQRTVWGSCSRKANLNFNFRLVMAPETVLEYIIVHELSHLKEPNHSTRFWETVEGVLPDYRDHRKWIKEYGDELVL